MKDLRSRGLNNCLIVVSLPFLSSLLLSYYRPEYDNCELTKLSSTWLITQYHKCNEMILSEPIGMAVCPLYLHMQMVAEFTKLLPDTKGKGT